MGIPPRDVFAHLVADTLAQHTKWDSMHEFVTLHWDGRKLVPGTLAVIDTAIHPNAYPGVMGRCALQAIKVQAVKPEPDLYAYLLKFEAYAVPEPDATATARERRDFDQDRRGRAFHKRADAIEMLGVYCMDVHGRLWTGSKRRDTGEVHHDFYADSSQAVSGQFITGLRRVAAATAAAVHGLPSHFGRPA